MMINLFFQHPILSIIFGIINITAFIIYGIDKHRAITNRFRISEAVLLMLAFFGGALGALAGMKVFRHKTKKPIFKKGVPAFLFLQIALIYYIFY